MQHDANLTLPEVAQMAWASFALGAGAAGAAGAAIGLATWHDSSTLDLAEKLKRGQALGF